VRRESGERGGRERKKRDRECVIVCLCFAVPCAVMTSL
jgi:hypothetical protein